MKNKCVQLILLVAGSISGLSAQQLERSTTDLGGGVGKSSEYQLHYSIGGNFVATVDLGDLIVSGGFIQGSIVEEPTPIYDLFPNISLSVSPNPTIDRLILQASEQGPGGNYLLYDVTGRLVTQSPFKMQTRLDLSTQPAGTYFLRWLSGDKVVVKQFKIVKQ